jgi:hypothetical protein
MTDELAMAAERLRTGAAWADFCDVLRLAGEGIEQMGDDLTDVDRAEWYRHVTRLLRVACERYVENTEPDRPRLRITPWRTSVNVQSPDQDHLLCELVGTDRTYEITGTRGTVPYFVIASMTSPRPPHPGAAAWAEAGFDSLPGFDPSKSRALASIASDDIDVEPDGTFTVRFGGEPQERNWLPLHEDSVGLIVRTVHHDRSVEVPPTFAISLVDPPPPRPRLPHETADGLAIAAQMVLGFVNRTAQWKRDLEDRPNELEFSRERYLTHGGVADREFAFGVWRKQPDEVLVLEFVPPACEYWNFQLCNVWQENLDTYEDGHGYVTGTTAVVEPDGTVRIVVADADPGLGGNWLDSFGHGSGLMGLRFIKTAGAPEVTVRRFPAADVASPSWPGLAAVPTAPNVVR